MPYISIAIPCYEMKGKGLDFLDFSFKQIKKQTFKDYEVVISDQSSDYSIQLLCENWSNQINIKYFRNEEKRGYFTANRNFGNKKCQGEIIKFLDQDDYLFDEQSLEKIVNVFDEKTNWLVSSYIHTYDRLNFFNYHIPSLNDRIYLINTIGSPTCLTIRNKDVILMDENLKWIGDAEYYKQLFDKFGIPKILLDITAVNYLWAGQTSISVAVEELRNKENQYVINKYENRRI